jgi:hypothetical protein
MNPNMCKCSGLLVFKEFGFGKMVKDCHCIDFVYTCPKCLQMVIHSRVPTVYGYITIEVQNIDRGVFND